MQTRQSEMVRVSAARSGWEKNSALPHALQQNDDLQPPMTGRVSRRGVPWCPEDRQTLRELYQVTPIAELAARLGVSEKNLRAQALRMGLRRPTNSGRDLPLGSERINKGVRERKVAHSGRRTSWKRVDVIEWEALFGPVPIDHMLVLLPGKERRAENLTLVPVEEHPLGAGVNLAPPALRKLLSLKAQFTRQMNKIEAGHPPTLVAPAGHRTAWSPAQDAYLRRNLGILTYVAIAQVLKRTPKAVQRRAERLSDRRP